MNINESLDFFSNIKILTFFSRSQNFPGFHKGMTFKLVLKVLVESLFRDVPLSCDVFHDFELFELFLADDGKVLILKRKQIYALPQSLSKNGV